ncbi:MAG TPA: UDP-N-acetylglucosamine 1-carboxyvinyltransferase [Patescibacteria group bacterium]|nr:UDP-N-acetylglucosamine 1-carboxyvinyltransferase [Patescibacteria group bacterium]
MSYYLIQGDKKLSGSVRVNSTKNSAVALLCASLINQGTTELFNFPDLEETRRIIKVLESLGVELKWKGPRRLLIKPPKNLRLDKIDYKTASKTRSVLLLLGSLVHRQKKFRLPRSGGCKLGLRTVKPYVYAFENFGIRIKTLAKYYNVDATRKKPASEIILYESGDTVTEAVLMAASLFKNETTVKYASANYQVQEICFFLSKLGVKITGLGGTTLVIRGVGRVNKNVKYQLAEDPIDAILFIALAATTNSAITIKGCPIDFLELELLKLAKMGFKYEILRRYFSKNKKTRLVDIKTKPSKLKALAEKIYARPYPGLNIDNLPFFVPIATRAKGTTLIHDWVYENRAIYYNELARLGAKITLADPHRVFIEGPTRLTGTEIVCPPALRPSIIILIAMMASRGKSILRNIEGIDRGYEDLENRLKNLGAKIKRIND